MTRAAEGLARSIQTRLASHAKAIRADPNLVLTRFATERLLYRLSVSPHAERFVLKGRRRTNRTQAVSAVSPMRSRKRRRQ